MEISSNAIEKEQRGPFMVKKFKWVERNTTTFQNMVEGVLYYPED